MSKKVEVLTKNVESLTEVKQTLVDIELGKPVSAYDSILKVEKVENVTECLDALKDLIFWEDAEQELILLNLSPSEEDPRISTKLHFFDIDQLQHFVAEYEHYDQKNRSDIFFKQFIEDYSLSNLDRIRIDLERNRNEALGIVNYNLEPEYKYTTDLIDEIVQKIKMVLDNNQYNLVER